MALLAKKLPMNLQVAGSDSEGTEGWALEERVGSRALRYILGGVRKWALFSEV